MAYRLRPTRLVEVLLPVLAALYHETEVPAGGESLPGSYLTQIKTLVETRLVRSFSCWRRSCSPQRS